MPEIESAEFMPPENLMATNWNSVDVVWSIGFFFNIDCLLDWFKILHLQIKTVNTWVGSDIQNAFASVRRKLLGTRVDERHWATRHLSKGNDWGGEKDDLGEFEDKSFDVVFTDAVLIYVVPDKIEKVVREMLRVARRALIFLEWHCFDSGCSVRGTYVSHWMRDYVSLLKEFVPPHRIEVTKLPKGLWTDEKW